jgi:hypothetical protein
MKQLLIIILIFTFLSCEKEEIKHPDLEGYWQIVSVDKLQYSEPYMLQINNKYFRVDLDYNAYNGQIESTGNNICFYFVARNNKEKDSTRALRIIGSLNGAEKYEIKQDTLKIRGTYTLTFKKLRI